MHQASSGKVSHLRFKFLLSLVVLVCLSLFITSQAAFAASDYDFLAKWGTNGVSNGQFNDPRGIAIDSSGNIYVADTYNHRVQKFNSSGTFVTKWGKNSGDGTSGSGNGEFNYPIGMDIDSSGNIYVVDYGNHRVQKFDSDGVYLDKFGTNGTGDGQFNHPYDVAIDSSGNIYVADGDNHRVQKFNSSGAFVAKWGKNGGDGTSGSGNGEFSHPYGIVVDSSNSVYVTDYDNQRVQKFDSSGVYLDKFGTNGTGDGQFNHPYGIAVDSHGNVYVADRDNHRVQKFNSSGAFVAKWGKNGGDGTSGSGDGEFSSPRGIALDSSGNVYVADSTNHRIQKFKRTDTSYVAADKAWLTFDQIKKSNTSESEITSDLNLMTSAPDGSTIFWTSNNESVIGTDGTVNRPAYGTSDAGVTLTATLTKGTAADTKTFSLNVKESAAAPTTTPTASSFTDVPSTAWYKTYVDTLVSKGIISGYADNTFRPNIYVTRAEFSKMLSLALGWTTTSTVTSSFPDVLPSDWSSPYVEAAKTNGALSGYPDGTFGPSKTITRAEIAVVVARVKGLASVAATFTDTTGHWANGQIGACSNAGILSGYPDGTFEPDGSATRAEAAKLITALL